VVEDNKVTQLAHVGRLNGFRALRRIHREEQFFGVVVWTLASPGADDSAIIDVF